MSSTFPRHTRPRRCKPAWRDDSTSKPVLHILPQRWVGGQLRLFRPTGHPFGVPLRGARQVIQIAATRRRVAPQLRDTVDADRLNRRATSRMPNPCARQSAIPPVPQRQDSAQTTIPTSAASATAPSRPPAETIGCRPAVIPPPPSQRPRSTNLRRSKLKTAAGDLAAPLAADREISACVAKPDPSVAVPPLQLSYLPVLRRSVESAQTSGPPGPAPAAPRGPDAWWSPRSGGGLAPARPAARINRAMRLRPCFSPLARSSACTRGGPYVSRELA